MPTQDELRRVCEALKLGPCHWSRRVTHYPDGRRRDHPLLEHTSVEPEGDEWEPVYPPLHESEAWAVRARQRAADLGARVMFRVEPEGGLKICRVEAAGRTFDRRGLTEMEASFEAIKAAVDAGAIGGER